MCLHTHSHLAVCSVTDLLHQFNGIFRTRLDNTFERLRNPSVVPQDGQHLPHFRLMALRNVPKGDTVELRLEYSRLPIIIQDRPNVKYRQYASDDEVHRLES